MAHRDPQDDQFYNQHQQGADGDDAGKRHAPPGDGTTTALSVLGADDGGEANLTYTWAATTLPGGGHAPTFSANGTNAAKNTHGHVQQGGHLHLHGDDHGRGRPDGHQQRERDGEPDADDDRGEPVAGQPECGEPRSSSRPRGRTSSALPWPRSRRSPGRRPAGTISTGGLFTAPNTSASGTVTATSGTVSGTATVTVTSTSADGGDGGQRHAQPGDRDDHEPLGAGGGRRRAKRT